ncbi:MAG: T9SS type A sorting domain-containing protein [Candidatus Zhuqueibacterota bacterium]
MNLKKLTRILFAWLIVFQFGYVNAASLTSLTGNDECTIGVASGKATPDGRPLLWKTRDTSERNNGIIYSTSKKYKYIAVNTVGGSTAWMGVNEKGLAILNSDSSDLPGGSSGPGNGTVMTNALGTCATVDEFQNYLDETNITGRTTHSNFGVIDSTGAAAIFETAGSEYWKFDANDSIQAPNGYVLRTNFAFNGAAAEGIHSGIYSIERYWRQEQLMSDFHSGDSLTYHSILRYQMRDFSDFDSDPVPVPYPRTWIPDRPYGYIYCDVSICRTTSTSAVVFHGVQPQESAKLTTMWTMLGQPAAAIVVPYWPVGQVPTAARGTSNAPLCDVALNIRELLFDYAENSSYLDSYKLRDGLGGGVWTKSFVAEDYIFDEAEQKLNAWRSAGLNVSDMLLTESDLAGYALTALMDIYQGMISSVEPVAISTTPDDFALLQNYPNPFNASTNFRFVLPKSSLVQFTIYNALGEQVAAILGRNLDAGQHIFPWSAGTLCSGIYIFQLEATPADGSRQFRQALKLQVIK